MTHEPVQESSSIHVEFSGGELVRMIVQLLFEEDAAKIRDGENIPFRIMFWDPHLVQKVNDAFDANPELYDLLRKRLEDIKNLRLRRHHPVPMTNIP